MINSRPIPIAFLIFIFLSSKLLGQYTIDNTNSREYLLKGYEYYEQKKYDLAIEKYQMINRNDTNFQVALSEIAICQHELERFEETIATNWKAIQQAETLSPELFINLGNSYDAAGKKDSAVLIYNEGISLFPMNHLLYFNRGVTYYNLDKFNESMSSLKEAININPSHSGTHLFLGAIAVTEGKIVQAMLSYNTFLLLEPESARALNVLSYLDALAGGNAPSEEAKGFKLSEGDDFEDIESIIKDELALSAKYKVKADFQYDIIKQNHVLFEKLEYVANDKGFWMQTYVPFYIKLFEEGWFDEFSNYILLSSDNAKVQSTVKKEMTSIKKFNQWHIDNWWDLHAEHQATINNKKQSAKYYYYDGHLQFVGNNSSTTEFVPTGDAKYYHGTGAKASEGKYDQNGKRIGRWIFYNSDGKKSEEGDYKLDKPEGNYYTYYDNGVLSGEGVYKNGLLNGVVKNYFRSGDIYTIENYKNGKLNGKNITYYRNGKIEFEVEYIDDKVNGLLIGYHPDGTKEQESNFKDNERDGLSTFYFRNGKVQSKTMYKAGKTNGPFTEYYNNGNIAEEGESKDGNIVGEYKTYLFDGKLEEVTNYDESGKLNGSTKIYDWDGKLYYELIHTKGEISEYKYYNKNDEIIGQAKRKLTKFPFIGYFPDGTKKFEGDYVGSEQNGVWKYYDIFGNLETEYNYVDGSLEGITKEYFSNGQLASKTTYKNNMQNGLFESYYINGRIRQHGWYVNDKAEGEWHDFNIDGTIASQTYYVFDNQHGWNAQYDITGKITDDTYFEYNYAKKVILFDTLGNRIDTIDLSSNNATFAYDHYNGKKDFRGAYKNGEAEGKFIWYFSNGQTNTEGNYLEGKRDGDWKWYFERNGKIKYEASYDFGNDTGVWRDYYENGQLDFERTMINDNEEGEAKYFHESGKQHIQGQFVKGKRHGAFYYYDEVGELQIIKYYEHGKQTGYSYNGTDGKPLPVITLSNGTGTVKAFYKNGKKSMEYTLKNGDLDGKYMEWFSNGNVWEEVNYKYGWENGISKMYFSNGKLQYEESHYYGELDGKCTYYYKDGKVERIVNYKTGARHGKTEWYLPSGKLEKTIIFYDGKVASES